MNAFQEIDLDAEIYYTVRTVDLTVLVAEENASGSLGEMHWQTPVVKDK